MKKHITSKLIIQSLTIGVCSLILWSWYQGRGPDQSAKAPAKTELSVKPKNEISSVEVPAQVIQPKIRHVVIQPAGAVKVPKVTAAAPDAVKNFRNWAESYFAAEPADRAKLISKGQELADLHRVAMKQTIPNDPKLALELAVPMVVRQDLPDEIEQRLESRVNDRGSMMVLGVVPEESAQSSNKTASARHLFEPESAGAGNFYNAYLYGSRSKMRSRKSTRVSGVAVGGELAVLDSPVRVLEVGERPNPDKPTVEVCPISGKTTPIEQSANGQPAPVTAKAAVVEDNRKVYFLCASGHIGQFGDQLTQDEADAHWGKKVLAEGGTGGGATPFNVPPGWTTGTKKLLYLRVAFPDVMRDPQTEASCYENLRKATEYYMTNSYGQFYLTPTVAPLIVLPYPQTWYNSSTSVIGNQPNGEFVLRDHALTIAARMGYDANSFDLDVVEYVGGPGSFGGLGYVGAGGVWLKTSSVAVLTHELGHNLGLFHANYWVTNQPTLTGPGLNQEYGNKFDVMGSTGGVVMGPMVSVHKSILGWLSPGAVHQVKANGTYRIYQGDQDRADADKRYALAVKMDSERDYWFEFRQTHLTIPSFMNGLMVNWSAWGTGFRNNQAFGSNGGAHLLDMTPGSRPGNAAAGADSRDDAGLVVGQTYSDKDNDLHITPIFKSDTVKDKTAIPYMDVVVNRGPFPGNQKPSLTIEANTRVIRVEESITFTAFGTDAQRDALAYSWDFGDKTFSTDNSRIQTKRWAQPGRYSVLCVVSDMKGLRTIKSLLVEVQGLDQQGNEIVFEPIVSGTIRDGTPNNLPVEGVLVSNDPLENIYPASNTSQDGPAEFRSIYTDADGNYTLTNLAPGFTITVATANYPKIYIPQGVATYEPILGTDKVGLNWRESADIVPNVNVVVTTATATEGGASGTITLTRSSSSGILTVPVMLRSQGTATRDPDIVPGLDPNLDSDYRLSWRALPSTVELPIGQVYNGNNRDELRGCEGVSFRDGQATIIMTITPVNDTHAEGTEYAVVDIPDASYAYATDAAPRTVPYHVSGQRSAVVAILDNDTTLPQVKLSVDDPSIGENGDRGIVRVTRDGSVTNPLTVNLDYPLKDPLDGTDIATNGSDFSAPLTVEIPVGQTEATFSISAINDPYAEGTERFSVSLKTSASYVKNSLSNQSTFFVLDNDQPIVQVTAPVPNCTEASPTPARFVVTRSAVDIGEDLLVKFSLGGSALSGSDYRRIEGVAVIPANELSADILIVPIADSIDELDQTVVLRLATDPEYAVGLSNEAVITIKDTNISQFTLVPLSDPFLELDETRTLYRIERPAPGPTGSSIKVRYQISSAKSTATVNSDYNSPYGTDPAGEIEFLEKDLSKTIAITIKNDGVAEPTEKLVVQLLPSSAQNYSLGFETEATVLILDRDSPGVTVSFVERTGSLNNISENPARRIQFQFWRPGSGDAIANPMEVFYSLSGKAELGTDYTLAPPQTLGVVTIQPTQNRATLELNVINDSIPRGSRDLVVSIEPDIDNSYGIRWGKSSIVIDDDEGYPGSSPVVGFSTATSTVNEKTALKATEQNVTVSISSLPTTGEVTVQYRLIGGSATGRGVDYSLKIPATDLDPLIPTTGFLRFSTTGATSKTFAIVTNPDTTPEGDETIEFELVNAVGANIGTRTHTVTLRDDAVPEVFTDPITGPAHTSATLTGKYIASNLITTSYFEWGTSPASLPNRTIDQNPAGNGTSFVPMSQFLGNLKYPGTYYYRAVATNAMGVSKGIVRMIRTQAPPTVVTTLDAGHTANSITLAGTINPNRGSLRYYFRTGDSPTNLSVPPPPEEWFSLPNGTKPVVVTQTITGLPEGTILYYQLEAVSDSGLGGTRVGGVQVSTAVPYLTTGNLIVNASANHSTAGTNAWKNLGTSLGDFVAAVPTFVSPNVHGTGLPGVFFDGKTMAYELAAPSFTSPDPNPWAGIIGSANRTIEVWAYNPGYGSPDTLVNMGKEGVDTQVAISHSNLTQPDGAVRHGTVAKNNAAYAAKTLPPLARWNHYAYVYEGAKKPATLYINGVKAVTVPGLTLATSSEAITLGASRNASSVLGKFMQGYINSMRIHDGVLKPADVLFNFRVGPVQNAPAVPVPVTTGVSGLTPTSVTLNGTVASIGMPATAWIEWGTSDSYDNASAPIPVPNSPVPTVVTLNVPNLVPGVEYHYRVVSRNALGFSYGEDVTFVPQVLPSAGKLWVDLRAQDFTGGPSWMNRGALGAFDKVGTPSVSADVAGTGYPGVQFDGTSSAFESASKADIDFSYGDDQTLEVWAFNQAIGSNETLVNQGRDITPFSRLRLTYSGADDGTSWVPAPTVGAWTHFAVVVSAGTRTLYINGVPSGSVTPVAGVNQWDDQVLLGANRSEAGLRDFTEAFSGFINTVRIHGGAMLPAQIKASFDAGPSTETASFGLAPVVVTSAPPAMISDVHATLGGTVQAGGLPTTYWIEWGTSLAFGNQTPPTRLSNSYSLNTVSVPVGGLPAATLIHYRLVAENSQGRTPGGTLTFTTLGSALAGVPKAQTNPATLIVLGKATLNGLASAGTAPATAWFEYGTTAEMSLRSPKVTIPANAPPRAMTFVAAALPPHTAYTFRLVVESTNGSVVGATQAFTSFNSLPVVAAVAMKVVENVPMLIPFKGTDADKEPITYTISTGPTNGTITGTSPNFFYTATNASLSGTDSFQYTATDGAATSTAAAVTVSITPVNDAPVATSATLTSPTLSGTLVGTDEEGDSITVFLLSKQPDSGSVALNANTGVFSYTPNVGFYGTDTFEFRVVAGGQTSAPGVITLNVTAATPTALATNVFTPKNVDVDGQVLASRFNSTAGFTKVTDPNPLHGTISAFDVDTGSFTFVPETDYVGLATFTFTVTEGMTTSAPATVTIVVGGPEANSDEFSGVEDDVVVVSTPLPATDPNSTLPLTYSVVATANVKNGVLLMKPDGTFTYNPKAGFVGVDRFEYQVTNGTLFSNPAAVTITITKRPPNWVWSQGPNIAKQSGIYGTRRAANSANMPGARGDFVSWAEPNGTLWIFGGQGFAEGKVAGLLNDLWKRDPMTGLWTWVSGSNGMNAKANYGAQGLSEDTNQPGARSGAVSWLDQDGTLWMFGGNGFDETSAKAGALNDLWSFDPNSLEWTWWKGSSIVNVNGTYGVKGASSSTSTPGARQGATAWVDGENTLWLFGGLGQPGTGTVSGPLNDLWKYIPAENTWTWVSGESGLNAVGVYGELGGISSVANPGARSFASGWVDHDGLLYLYGGNGLGAAPKTVGLLNDLWVYYPESNRWSWIKGSPALGAPTVSGLLGVTNPSNVPSGRAGSMTWITGNQEVWMFGGQTRSGLVNDLWRFDLTSKSWTLLKSPTTAGVYGSILVGAPSNTPGSRRGSAAFTDSSGDLWLLGGANAANAFNDLWLLDALDTVSVQTLAATSVTNTSADINAEITVRKAGASFGFNYWPLGRLADLIEISGGSSDQEGLVPITESISALQSGTKYAFRAFAVENGIRTYGKIMVFETTGSPPAISVGFGLANDTTNEGNGSYFVAVELSAPSSELVTVPVIPTLPGPLTISGVAEVNDDYGTLPSVISFPPGQTTFWIRVPLVNDSLSESDELLTLTLGVPSGSTTLGAQSTFDLTIQDDDILPRIDSLNQPVSQFVRLGQPVELKVTSAGDPLKLKYQWKSNNNNIPNATSSTYKFIATLASAARYTCFVSNDAGSTTSTIAEIFVLDSKPQLRVVEKGDVVMSVVAAAPLGAKISYRWRYSDEPETRVIAEGPSIIGTQSPAMTIKNVRPEDSRGYICRVFKAGQSSLSLDAFLQELSVPNAPPTIPGASPFSLPTGVVGVPYSYQVVVGSDLRTLPTKYAATNLPKGLTINAKTGLISGRPTVVAAPQNVSITASNVYNTVDTLGKPSAVTNSVTRTGIRITILGLPTGVQGTYVGLIDRAPATMNMGGRVDLAITPAGAYTLKLNLSGLSASASGSVAPIIVGNTVPYVEGTAEFKRKAGQSNLRLKFTVTSAGEMTADLTDLQTVPLTASCTGVRLGYSAADNPPNPGDYTMLFDLRDPQVGVLRIPQGNGFATMALAKDGKITGVGRTADGNAFTLATILGADGKMPVFASFTPILGTLHGVPSLVPDIAPNSYINGTVTWNKAAAPSPVRSLLYHEGFSPITMDVLGGRYLPVENGAVVRGLVNNANKAINARLEFSEGGLLTSELDMSVLSITNPAPPVKTTQLIVLPSNNPNNLTFVLPAKPAGSFNGKVDILNSRKELVRNLTYQGVMARVKDPNTSVIEWKAAGFVLVPQLPQPGQTIKTSTVLSGQVVLEPTP